MRLGEFRLNLAQLFFAYGFAAIGFQDAGAASVFLQFVLGLLQDFLCLLALREIAVGEDLSDRFAVLDFHRHSAPFDPAPGTVAVGQAIVHVERFTRDQRTFHRRLKGLAAVGVHHADGSLNGPGEAARRQSKSRLGSFTLEPTIGAAPVS